MRHSYEGGGGVNVGERREEKKYRERMKERTYEERVSSQSESACRVRNALRDLRVSCNLSRKQYAIYAIQCTIP
jgi:hypothetical protein